MRRVNQLTTCAGRPKAQVANLLILNSTSEENKFIPQHSDILITMTQTGKNIVNVN